VPTDAPGAAATRRLEKVLNMEFPSRVVACSGGIDSLVLATIAHRSDATGTVVAHAVTPAVPADCTARVMAYAEREGWDLEVVRPREFEDERYLSNPTDRCYYCKTHLYTALEEISRSSFGPRSATTLSGANVDDLGDYRPGLLAALEHRVRHPYVEAGLHKADVRAIARGLGLAEADIPSSPCLASRLYTGTRVRAVTLQAVYSGEEILRLLTGVSVARCRVRGKEVLVEVPEADRPLVTESVLAAVARAMSAVSPELVAVSLDDRPYRAGRAVLRVS